MIKLFLLVFGFCCSFFVNSESGLGFICRGYETQISSLIMYEQNSLRPKINELLNIKCVNLFHYHESLYADDKLNRLYEKWTDVLVAIIRKFGPIKIEDAGQVDTRIELIRNFSYGVIKLEIDEFYDSLKKLDNKRIVLAQKLAVFSQRIQNQDINNMDENIELIERACDKLFQKIVQAEETFLEIENLIDKINDANEKLNEFLDNLKAKYSS